MSNDNSANHASQSARDLASQLDDNVDADVAQRLRAARALAVEAADRRNTANRWRAAIPLGGAAAAAAVVAMLLIRDDGVVVDPSIDAQQVAAVSELEVLESLELLEALEMLAWLDDEVLSDAG
ncbi:MAG: hypothetical protein AAF004_10685 [Pseudomonadota bacterium]